MSNPFSPGFGKLPQIYLGRDDDVEKIVESMGDRNSPYQTTLVYGMRGTGKTAFLTDIGREMRRRKKWIVVDLVMGTPLLQVLLDSIYLSRENAVKKILSGIDGISVSAFGVSLTSAEKNPSHQYQVLLMKVLAELKKKGIWILITIDEVKSTPELREFASVYQLLVRNEYNVCLIMAGLPQNVSTLQNDDVLTFLLRAGRITLAPIDLWLIHDSYQQAFRGTKAISEELLVEITKLTRGYAYAFQLLGYYLWENSDCEITQSTIANALPLYRSDLYRNSYVKIYQSMTEMEKKFLIAMAETGEDNVKFGAIVKAMGKPKNYVSTYRIRLLDTQVITSAGHGLLRFSLPLFREFVIRNKELSS